MKKNTSKILSLIASLFVASNAFAWTPTVEVVRNQTGVVQLKAGGWTTQAEMNEMNWASYRVWMMLNGQEFDVTAAVVSLFTSGHPSVSFTLNGHFDLSIALLQYFGIDPLLHPIGMEVCKQAAFGGECADSRGSLVKRKPWDSTANATCYPSEMCATGTGLPGGAVLAGMAQNQNGVAYGIPGIPVTFDKTTVITGFRAVVSVGQFNGVPTNTWFGGLPRLNVNSSLSVYAANPFQGDIGDNLPLTFDTAAPTPFGQTAGSCPVCFSTGYGELSLPTPLVLPAGSYVLSPYLYFIPGGYYWSSITSVNLGTDYEIAQNLPNVLQPVTQFAPQTTGTLAIDIKGY